MLTLVILMSYKLLSYLSSLVNNVSIIVCVCVLGLFTLTTSFNHMCEHNIIICEVSILCKLLSNVSIIFSCNTGYFHKIKKIFLYLMSEFHFYSKICHFFKEILPLEQCKRVTCMHYDFAVSM